MTVSTTDSVVEYVSGGPAYPIPYRFLQDADIEAVLVKQDGNSETLTGAQYTLIGAGTQSGGTLTSSYAADYLATPGASLTISRVMDPVQPTDLRNQGRFLAETHESVFDRLTMLIQQGFAGIARALKRPVGKSYFDAEGRRIANVQDPAEDDDATNKGWVTNLIAQILQTGQGPINNAANVIMVGANGYIGVVQDLADKINALKGAAMLGHKGRTLAQKLDDIPSVMDFGAVGDGVTDDTAAFQALADLGGLGLIPAPPSAYIVSSVSLTKGITWFGDGDASVIRRKAGVDTASALDATSGMFKPVAHGQTYTIRDVLFDGNEANQIPFQPYGYLIRLQNIPGTAGSRLSIIIDNCTFINATQCCICADGDTGTDGYEEITVTNCRFVDGRYGLAAGNPNVTSPNGYGPDYILLTDKVYANIRGNSFLFNRALSAGEFSRTAVRITFNVNTDNTDGSRAHIIGNYFYRCGRGERDGPQRPVNDVGVIDAYARGRELRITDNLFESCEGTPIRGKTNCDLVFISGNISDTSSRNPGINIAPNSYAQQSGRIVIVNNIIRQASGFGIAVTGNAGVIGGPDDINGGENIQDYVSDILISGNVIEGVNLWSMQGTPALGDGILARNFKNLVVANNLLGGMAGNGIRFRGQPGAENPNSQYLTVTGNRVEAAAGFSYYLADGFIGPAIFEGNAAVNSGSYGFELLATSGAGASLTFNGNTSEGSVDYGAHFRFWDILTANGNHAKGVTGLSRGFYPQDIASLAKLSANYTNATTPLVGPGTPFIQEHFNTWNPRVLYGTVAPTTGTWTVGDVVYNSAPSAGGNVGWVCTASGTPGTWKTFGSIAA